MVKTLQELTRPNIWRLKPYSSARDEYNGAAASVFLDANENPYNMPHNRYPDPMQRELKTELSKIKKVSPDSIFLGNGSDEAIDLVFRAFCEPRVDNVVAIDPTYGMYQVCADVNDVEYRKVLLDEDFQFSADKLLAAADEHTKLIFAETIGNPCLDVTDIEKLAEIAHAHDIPLVVDNTTSTAYLIQVLKHGADIVVNSSSKYINGSSNAISGILTDSGKFKWDKNRYPGFADYVKYGPMAFVAKLRNSLFRNMGACLAPVNAYLNIIGLETLGLRMERECSNALELASWIENNYPDIKVNYPGLCSSKWHEIAKKQLTNGYGAILTIRVGSKEKAFKFIDSLTIPYTLSNIGDTKTLVIHPGSTISLHSTDKQKEDAGVFEDLIRVSVGIEDIDDLKEDFAQAFANIAD